MRLTLILFIFSFCAHAHIIHSLSPEIRDLFGTGGLQHAVIDKAIYIKKQGSDIKLVMPFYTILEERVLDNYKVLDSNLSIDLNHGQSVFTYDVVEFDHPVHRDLKIIAIRHKPGAGYDNIFNNKTSNGTKLYSLHPNDGETFGFFAKAYTNWIDKIKLNYQPDFVILNDWHTGFTSVLLEERKEKYLEDIKARKTPSFSKKIPYVQGVIHNLKYQGVFDPNVFGWVGLDLKYFHSTEMYGNINFLKTMLVHADYIEAVSENYSREILTKQFSEGLLDITKQVAAEGRLSGQLNGINPAAWNPQNPKIGIDGFDSLGFDLENLQNKSRGRELLSEYVFGRMPKDNTLIIAMTARLDDQKGFGFLLGEDGTLNKVLSDKTINVNFVIAGDPHGDRTKSPIVQELIKLEERYPDKIKLFKFSPQLERMFLYFSDMYLGASIFEPSGLAQMFAQNVGTPPIVSKVGGHVDSVSDLKTGLLFELEYTNGVLDKSRSADNAYQRIKDAFEIFQDKEAKTSLIRNAMNLNNSWANRVYRFEEFMDLSISSFYEHKNPDRARYINNNTVDIDAAFKDYQKAGKLCPVYFTRSAGLRF